MFKLCSHATPLFSSPWPSIICRKFHSSPVLFANVKTCHYEVLGISRTASPDDVKKAYLQKAREHHPDLNKDSPHANQKFLEISKAYEILKDSSSRTHYDYEIRHTTTRTESYSRRPSPGESYSSNPNRRNSMFVEEDEDIFGEEGEIEFDEDDFAEMNFDKAFNIDLSNLFRMAGVRMGGGGRMHSFKINSKFSGKNGFNIHDVMDALHRHQMRHKQKRKTMQHKQQTQRQRQQQQNQFRQGPSNTKQQNKKYNGEDGEERVKGSKKQAKDAQSWYDFNQQGGKKANTNDFKQNNKNTNNTTNDSTNNNKNNNRNNKNNKDTKNSKKFTEEEFEGAFKPHARMSKQEKKWWDKTSKMFYNKKQR